MLWGRIQICPIFVSPATDLLASRSPSATSMLVRTDQIATSIRFLAIQAIPIKLCNGTG